MIPSFFAVAALVTLTACGDRFEAPQLPDLHKTPYDFAVAVPPYTGPGSDMTVDTHDLYKGD